MNESITLTHIKTNENRMAYNLIDIIKTIYIINIYLINMNLIKDSKLFTFKYFLGLL